MGNNMIFSFRNLNISAICLSLCFIFACNANAEKALKHADIAIQFRDAINKDDINTLVKLTSAPLRIQEQEWQSAQDGIGFVLGKRNTQRIEKDADLSKFYAGFAPKIVIEGIQAIPVAGEELDNFKEELAESSSQWRALHVYLFKRGEGDVEHIVLLGINPQNHKISAIYIN